MRGRIYFFYILLIIGLAILVGQAGKLQLIYGDYYREIAEGNRIKKITLPAPRGIIYDRKGRALVRNKPIYKFKIQNSKFKILSRKEALKIKAKGGEEAWNLLEEVGREYVYGKALVHVLGYLTEANEEEVKSGRYQLGDLVGRGGVEEEYDFWLRGQDGGEVFEVNALGEKIREIGIQQPVPGKDLYLNIDAELSKVAFEALEGKKGAVVVSEARTGAILALVSSPSFDPEKITPEVLADKNQPLFNRAVAGLYPPGSTFKIVTATAGLEEGKIDKNTTYVDTGEIRVGNYVYKNWYFTQYGKTEGEINVVGALRRSTDTFFYKVGEWVGPTRLAEWARAFGFGKPTGVDLPVEAAGRVPDPSSSQWFLGNTYHFAIGQGDLLVTPIQVNVMTSVIANDGKLCPPTIADFSRLTKFPTWEKLSMKKSTSDGDRLDPLAGGGSHDSSEVNECQDLQLKSETLRVVKEGMRWACAPGGTAFPLFNFSPAAACKTGTAEFGDPAGRTHAWLTAFAPADDPQIVVTVLVEAGGEGSRVAAPIVKKVLEEWFRE
jgi:penicillin-binding protein 2